LGGLRAVAWTDCLQGLLRLVGLAGILLAASPDSGHLRATTEWVLAHEPQKAVVPPWSLCATWMSTILLIGLSGAVYPQAIQRIYAAYSVRTLKRSLSVMIFMPLATSFIVFLVGILGIEHFAALGELAADQIMPMLLREWAARSWWMYAMAMLVVTGIVAAIMSTADSVLLSLSSILAKDFAGKHLLKTASEATLTRLGKLLPWAVISILVLIALAPRITLWGLTELKMEILAQVSPVFLLGLSWKRLTAPAAFSGMLAGTALAAGMTLVGYGKLWGIHAGLLGWGLNMAVSITLSYLPLRVAPSLPSPRPTATGYDGG
ncbi:MAG: sodium:solute symporter family protein, partial [Acidobacteriota bacterium]